MRMACLAGICALAPAMAAAQPTPPPVVPTETCTGTVSSIEASRDAHPGAYLWLSNVSCVPALTTPPTQFRLIHPATGHIWHPGLAIATAAYSRASVNDRTVSVTYDANASGIPIVLRINAPCFAEGTHCVAQGAAQP